jgi:hypothetical protein
MIKDNDAEKYACDLLVLPNHGKDGLTKDCYEKIDAKKYLYQTCPALYYGDNGEGGTYDWCASFVSFCLLQSGATTQNSMSDWCRNHVADENSAKYDAEYAKYVWREVSCQKWVDNLKAAELYRLSAFNQGDYVPKSGDLIFFRWSPTKNVGHIGIVVYADSERVYTVEGNTSAGSTMVSNGGGVYFKSYALDYECIDGYGVLPYENVLEQTSIDYSGNMLRRDFT